MKHPLLSFCAPALCLATGACATLEAIPDALQPGPGASLAMVVPAKGVQRYECRAGKGAGEAPAWAFVAPDADLFDARGRRIGRHGAGPHWQADDGSRIAGTVKARAEAPDAGNIPWLLLSATSTGPAGSFSAVTSIQRVNTVGGLAPPKPCTVGEQASVPYSADYRFFASNPAKP